MARGAAGDRIEVLNNILSGIESASSELLVPRLAPGKPVMASKGVIKTITAGHMSDGDSVDAFKVAPGGNVPDAPELSFAPVDYLTDYRKLKALVPEESHRADLELPMPLVEMYSRHLMGTLLRNRDRVLVDLLESTAWGVVQDLSGGGLDAQWSDDTEDPIERLATVQDALPMSPNTLVFGAGAWREFKTHPLVRSALSINRDRAILSVEEFSQLIGNALGFERVVVYNMRVSTAGPTTAVAVGNLTRRFSDKVWMGRVDYGSGTPTVDARGNHELTVGPTAFAHLIEKDVDYKEAEQLSPGGRLMRLAMSYDMPVVTASLGARLDGVV